MEVCVDSVISAKHAEKGGAIRLELCGNLLEGGTTPTPGMLQIIKRCVRIPVFVMIRPRGGDFLYSQDEFEVMKENIISLRMADADGFVLGILTTTGEVDVARCTELIELCRPLQVTFHRAIDMTANIEQALESIISLGCERALTSGGESTALEGLPVIKLLVEQAKDRIIVMPGGGITPRNLKRILDGSEAKEFHGTARSTIATMMDYCKPGASSMGSTVNVSDNFQRKETDVDKVQTMIKIVENSRPNVSGINK